MSQVSGKYMSSRALRSELSGRGLVRVSASEPEVGYGRTPSVVYAEQEGSGHGNFLPASYRRIVTHPEWARRLEKTYTASRLLPRSGDRRRGELECASSSDALLMNVFCYPGVMARPEVCALLGAERGLKPEFGVRADLPMRKGEVDRTEMDMRLGSLLVEAKLTETGFGRASRERLLRYTGVEEMVDTEALPRSGNMYGGYQLVRGLLAAKRADASYVVLLDERRADLREQCFAVLSAVRSAEVRHRLRLRTWQELAAVLPRTVRMFLREKYGFELEVCAGAAVLNPPGCSEAW